jgi:protein-S-isoprenylcysteine O-methyltransferase Ste14
MSLKSKVALRFLLGLVVVGALLFIPADSLRFWQGWAYLMIWFVPSLLAFAYFYKHDPELVERRLRRKETLREQKLIMKFVYVTYVVAFLLPGFDHRFGWSHVPLWLTILSQAFVLGGWLMVFWVLKANSFAAATIRVEPDQKVISTGPYRIVRHPMYLGASVMFLFAPLALGSYFALPVFALLIPIIVFRLLNEEKVLRQELPGYAEYCLRIRFRWEEIMLGGLLFVVCVILQFHYHDKIPWYIWVLALIAQFVAFGEPAMRSAASKKN